MVFKSKTMMTGALHARYASLGRAALDSGELKRDLELTGLQWAGSRVVDLGAGPGQWDVALASAGAETIVWIDLSALMLDEARNLHAERGVAVLYAQARLEAVPIASSSIDICICHKVLYHASDERTVLEEVHRVLRPGGSLWIRCDSYRRVFSESGRPVWKRFLSLCAPFIARAFHKKVLPTNFCLMWFLRRDLGRTGFRIVEERRVNEIDRDFIVIKD